MLSQRRLHTVQFLLHEMLGQAELNNHEGENPERWLPL